MRSRLLRWGLAAASLAVPVGAAAQSPQVIEFDQAVARAVAANRSVAQAALAIDRAEALLQQARAATLPTVSATVSSVTLNREVGFDDRVTQPRTQVTFGATASMPILAPARWAATAQARDQVGVAELSAAEVRRQVGVAAAQAYLAVIAQRRQVEVTERSVETAREHLRYARSRREGGLGSRLNELRAEQVLATDEARLETARLAVVRAREALGVILGESGPVDAGQEPALDVPSAGATIEAAFEARPDLRWQRAIRDAAQRVFDDSIRDILPTGTVSFAPQYVTPRGLFQPSQSWRLTFSVTQPVFEGGQRAAAKQLRAAAVNQARLTIETLEIQVRSDVRLAQASVEAHARALTHARAAAARAADVLTITQGAFELGASTNLEVIDAQRVARDADAAAVVAEDNLRRARLDLLVALGVFRVE